MHRVFFDGLLEQVKVMHDQRLFIRSVQEYMDMRRGTIGVYPAIALTEYDILSYPQPHTRQLNVESTVLT